MYDSVKSAKITRGVTVSIGVILLGLMLFAYPILDYFPMKHENMITLMVAFYICCVPGYIALYSVFRLLTDIIKGDVFTQKTVKALRILSWCCAVVSIICLVCGLLYFPLLVFALGAGFMMLILRVLKNVMHRATEIKSENDMTI